MQDFENFIAVSEVLSKFQKLRKRTPLSILGYSFSKFKPQGKDSYLFDFKIEIDPRVFINIRFCEDQSLCSGKFIITRENSRRIRISFFGKFEPNSARSLMRSIIEVRKKGIKNEQVFKSDVEFVIKKCLLLGLSDIRKTGDKDDINGIDFFLIYKKKAIPLQLTSSWGTFFSKVKNKKLHPDVPCLVYKHGKYHPGILAGKLYEICEGYMEGKILNL